MTETIVGVALKFGDKVISMMAPSRHGDLYAADVVGENPTVAILLAEVGFLTSKERFVTREEAAKIALDYGQIEDAKISVLLSEYLW